MKTKFKRFFQNLRKIFCLPEMSVLPGQLAFFFILSLVPTITLIGYISSFLSISLNDVVEYFNINIDSNIFSILTPVLQTSGLNFGMIALLIIGIYLASNGTDSIIICANNIYGIKQKPYIYRRIKAIIMIFMIILLFLFILLVPIFGNFFLSLINNVTGFDAINGVFNILKMPFAWFVVFLFIKTLYTIAPDKTIPSAHVNFGAVFTSLGWILATEIYLYYVKHFANYTFYYSGLSNIAILMIWIYILATIFVIGMALNHYEEPYEIEKTQKLEEIKLAKKKKVEKVSDK